MKVVDVCKLILGLRAILPKLGTGREGPKLLEQSSDNQAYILNFAKELRKFVEDSSTVKIGKEALKQMLKSGLQNEGELKIFMGLVAELVHSSILVYSKNTNLICECEPISEPYFNRIELHLDQNFLIDVEKTLTNKFDFDSLFEDAPNLKEELAVSEDEEDDESDMVSVASDGGKANHKRMPSVASSLSEDGQEAGRKRAKVDNSGCEMYNRDYEKFERSLKKHQATIENEISQGADKEMNLETHKRFVAIQDISLKLFKWAENLDKALLDKAPACLQEVKCAKHCITARGLRLGHPKGRPPKKKAEGKGFLD